MVAGLRVFSRVGEVVGDANALPIVHVHGFAISGRYLEPTAARLASHYPTYVPDLPGHGYSEKPSRPLSIPELAEALAGYLDSVGVPRAVILGNSSGCLVAAEFAHRYPDRTERAVLVSPAGGTHNRPLLRGVVQLARDGLREPPSLARIAVPDYVRFGLKNSIQAFRRMTRYPTLRAALACSRPVPGRHRHAGSARLRVANGEDLAVHRPMWTWYVMSMPPTQSISATPRPWRASSTRTCGVNH